MSNFKKSYSKKLINAYLHYQQTSANESEWALFDVFDIIDGKDVKLSLALTIDLINASKSKKVLGMIAAGPLEDVLVGHGEIVIDEVIDLARKYTKVRKALKGVWTYSMSQEVGEKIERLLKSKNFDKSLKVFKSKSNK